VSAGADIPWMTPPVGGSKPTRLRRVFLLALALATVCALTAGLFVVDVSEFAVVTRFGRVVRVVDAPGLYMTMPIDRVLRLDRRLLLLDPPEAEYLTADKRNVVVRSLVAWRIVDPVRFLTGLGSRAHADARLADVASGEVGAVLGRHPFSALVSVGDGGRHWKLISEIRDQVDAAARSRFGIDVAEVSIHYLSLPEQNRQSVFERMRAERGRIAVRYRSEGALEAKKIVAAADREKVEINAKSYAQSERLRAEGDAAASRIYADAAGRYPRFYRFLRTLQADEKILTDDTVVVLPAEAEALGMLREAVTTPTGPRPPSGSSPGTSPPDSVPAPGFITRQPARAALDVLLGNPGVRGAGSDGP